MTPDRLGDPMEQPPILKTQRRDAITRHALSPEVGAMLRAARRRQGWTAERVARNVGVGVDHLYDLERGRRAPSKRVARALWMVLDLSMEEAEALIAESVGEPGWGR